MEIKVIFQASPEEGATVAAYYEGTMIEWVQVPWQGSQGGTTDLGIRRLFKKLVA